MKTPLDILSQQAQIPESLSLPPKVFGCSVFVHIPKHKRTKLSPCATKCVFVGYGVTQKGYRCFNTATKKVITTMNCNFLEFEFFYDGHLGSQGESSSWGTNEDSLSWLVYPSQLSLSAEDPPEPAPVATAGSPYLPEIPQSSSDPIRPISEVSPDSNNVEDTIEHVVVTENEEDNTVDSDTGRYILPPRSTRGIPAKKYSPEVIRTKSRYGVANFVRGNLTRQASAYEAALYEEEDLPRNAEEAMKHEHWREAMLTEMNALKKNNTWVKAESPKGVKPVGCRWVFTIKRKPDGSIERYCHSPNSQPNQLARRTGRDGINKEK